MTTAKQVRPPGTSDAYEPLSTAERIEGIASEADLVAGGALRAVEVAAVVLLGLLVSPPLLILVVVVVVPLLAMALIAAVLSAPYLLFHHLRTHDRRHASLLSHRLRAAGRALVDLAPHRIVADARKDGPGR